MGYKQINEESNNCAFDHDFQFRIAIDSTELELPGKVKKIEEILKRNLQNAKLSGKLMSFVDEEEANQWDARYYSRDRNQVGKEICVYIPNNIDKDKYNPQNYKICMLTLYSELQKAGIKMGYCTPYGDKGLLFEGKYPTPFSYTSFKPYDSPHGILHQRDPNPLDYPNPFTGIEFTKNDFEVHGIKYDPKTILEKNRIQSEIINETAYNLLLNGSSENLVKNVVVSFNSITSEDRTLPDILRDKKIINVALQLCNELRNELENSANKIQNEIDEISKKIKDSDNEDKKEQLIKLRAELYGEKKSGHKNICESYKQKIQKNTLFNTLFTKSPGQYIKGNMYPDQNLDQIEQFLEGKVNQAILDNSAIEKLINSMIEVLPLKVDSIYKDYIALRENVDILQSELPDIVKDDVNLKLAIEKNPKGMSELYFKLVHIMHSKRQYLHDLSLSHKKLFAFDFDQTITLHDTYNEYKISNNKKFKKSDPAFLSTVSDKDIWDNLRNPYETRLLIKNIIEKNHKMVIVTLHDNPAWVKRNLRVLLGKNLSNLVDQIDVIALQASPYDEKYSGNKQAAIKDLMHSNKIQYGVLIDDSVRHKPESENINFIHAETKQDLADPKKLTHNGAVYLHDIEKHVGLTDAINAKTEKLINYLHERDNRSSSQYIGSFWNLCTLFGGHSKATKEKAVYQLIEAMSDDSKKIDSQCYRALTQGQLKETVNSLNINPANFRGPKI